jgi:hypothetical protein
MSNNIDYFIVCHDQEIILRQICDKVFNKLSDYRFLFVGSGPINQINSETIICRHLPYNIEEYPYLCSFTAWYSVAKNNIANSNNISFIEYDTDIISKPILSNDLIENQINCYSITLFNHRVFYKSTPWLDIALKKVYNIDLQQFIDTHKPRYKFWPTTTNITLSKQILNEFVDWFLPMTELFKHDPCGAYVHERAFFIFCILNQLNIKYIPNILEHKQLASHGISDFYGSFLHSKNSLQLHDHMLKEYDQLYDSLDRRCKEEN